MNKISKNIVNLLNEKAAFYNCKEFIKNDPIQIPHLFKKKEDIEIAAFLTATISWGNRTSIIKNARKLVQLMDNDPYSFVSEAKDKELIPLSAFVHRTFNSDDCLGFTHSLKMIYKQDGGLEKIFSNGFNESGNIEGAFIYFRKKFMSNIELNRTGKHVPDILKGSAAKRLNMFLRWMVRADNKGVDFGIWKNIPASKLMIPLDVHVGNVARKLNLLERKQNDWTAVNELTSILRRIDSEDPIRYDFALFGLGVNE